jgi:uncharacterized protein (DUF1330 family)
MPAYVIADITVSDAKVFAEYAKLTPAVLARYGGRFIVRGGNAEALEGEWRPQRLVVLKFDSVEQARQWWNSPEYAPLRKTRQGATSKGNLVVAEGCEAPV